MTTLDRRSALGVLLGAAVPPYAHATAIVLDVRTRRVVEVHREDLAREWLLPPGSTIKPLALMALIESGKMRVDERFPCPGKLVIGGRSFACSHPRVGVPIEIATALAYSCNCFVTHFAQRFEAGELARYLRRDGLVEVQSADDVDARQLQAIGEARVLVTPMQLVTVYARLAAQAKGPILDGLEAAVDYGTAQLAALPHIKVAGKTGTVLTSGGARVAWFAGFAPARAPQVAIVTAVQGRSGGLDAAPMAGRILGERLR